MTRLASFLVVVALAGCEWRVDYDPCDEDGIGDGAIYADGAYYTAYGELWAKAGERPFEHCRVFVGPIYLHGVLSDFSDFDPLEEIGGFYDNGVDLPEPPDNWTGGVIAGFPNLKKITQEVYDYPTSGGIVVEGGVYLDGFESLEFIEGDFNCAGPDGLGTELRVVTGKIGCPEERLGKLEHAGYISYMGHPLPSLRTVGSLVILNPIPEAEIKLPLLEEVGGPDSGYPGELLVGGMSAVTLDLSSLRIVHGKLVIAAFTEIDLGVSEAERGAEMRRRFADVEVHGIRNICRNGPDDPCPWEDSCETVHGVGAIECCNDPWPECVDAPSGP